MSLTHPDPFYLYGRLREALQADTEMFADPVLFGARGTPAPLTHRSFRFQPGASRFLGRQRPGDSLSIQQTVTIHLTHDLTPNDHDSSYSIALGDWWAATVALLTSSTLSGLVQAIAQSGTFDASGSHIKQSIVVQCSYSIALPARSE